jgi:type II secretory pathway pseudopilin PulG
VKRRSAYSLVELIVTVGALSAIMSLILPAVQAARESARRNQCQGNLREIGLGLSKFETAFGALPVGRNAQHRWQHSWATAILPHIDQAAVFERYDYHRRWNSGTNAHVSNANIRLFRCPSATHKWDGKTDYGGNYGSSLTGLVPGFERGLAWEAGTFPPTNIELFGNYRDASVRVSEISDGTSQTFLVLEDADRPAAAGGQWASGHNCFAHDDGLINQNVSKEIFSCHPQSAHSLLADGSVRLLHESTEPAIIGALCTRGSGETFGQ